MNRTSAKQDIDWLFAQCESEMGVKSNFPSFIAASKVGRAQEDLAGEDAMIDALDRRAAASRLGAAARSRRVLAAFGRLAPEHKRVLEAAYEARQRPPVVRQALGQAAGVAPLTPAALAVSGWSWAWFARALGRGDPRAKTIVQEAQELLDAAVAAYGAARGATS